MNDDVLPPDTPGDQLEAVNAVLDGLATDDQRALVHASPQLAQLLDQFQANRRAVGQVQVSDQARELHIAAALAAFDDVHLASAAHGATGSNVGAVAAGVAAAPTNVVSLATHRRMYRTLLGAAAALVLIVGGVAALSSQGGSDQNSAATAAEAKVGDDEAATLDAPSPDLAATAAGAADTAATASAEASTALSQGAAAPVATDAADNAVAQTDAPAETTAAPRSTIGSIDSGAEPLQPIADDQQLAAYAAVPPAADDAQAVAPCGPANNDNTNLDNLGNVSYQSTPAVVIRDRTSGQVDVYALDGCRLLTTLQT